MAQCTLLCPGLLGPAVPLEELAQNDWPDRSRLPGLSMLFRRGQRQALTRQSVEHLVLSQLGYAVSPAAELPVALLRAQSDTATNSRSMWCLDPVYVQLDREMAYLTRPDTLALAENEARAIIASINSHFGDVLHVRYHAPGQWLVNIDLAVHTTTPTQAIQQDINRMQPSGRDAARWRLILNEIQMLLHAHPINETRMAAGKPPVNSVWLWGGGELQTGPTSLDVVYSDDSLAESAALRNAIAYATIPATITPEYFTAQNSLLILSQLLDAIRHKDVYTWLAELQYLDQHYLRPLLDLVSQGSLSCLVVCSDTLQLHIDKPRLGKWWQRIQQPRKAVLGLRASYGY